MASNICSLRSYDVPLLPSSSTTTTIREIVGATNNPYVSKSINIEIEKGETADKGFVESVKLNKEDSQKEYVDSSFNNKLYKQMQLQLQICHEKDTTYRNILTKFQKSDNSQSSGQYFDNGMTCSDYNQFGLGACNYAGSFPDSAWMSNPSTPIVASNVWKYERFCIPRANPNFNLVDQFLNS